MEILTLGPDQAAAHLLLAPGAGASVRSPFLEQIAGLVADRGVRVSRFDFAFVAGLRSGGGKRKPPPRADLVIPEYTRAIDRLASTLPAGQMLLIGGKSMGGRVASMIADEEFAVGRIAGLVCLGYPFHPTGKPEQLRTAHLENLKCPTLIVQGERDPFGSKGEVEGYALSKSIELCWIGDGDHDLGPRGGSGFTRKGNLAAAADAVAEFARRLQVR